MAPVPNDSYISTSFFAHDLLIAVMMGAVCNSETSVNFAKTRRYIPESSPR
jgi:hypothetical protein